MKKILSILFTLTVAINMFATDEVEFKASAPAQVIAGKPFQLTYSINKRAKDLRVPEFTDFDYVAGPFSSTSQSTSFVNGKRTSTFMVTYTYTLMGNKEGTYTLPSATIKVDGEQYTSNGVKITVLPPDQPTQSSSSSTSGQKQIDVSQEVSEGNIFIA